MNRINFNIKDRKLLMIFLVLIIFSVFTLTIAYAALNAVLTIQGNARVSAADWDIYLNNPMVTNGSATTNVPEIKTSSTLEFSTILNMPGDFYEFVVDVVNGGDIDAMIENVVKTPDLTAEQAKFLKYEVSYENGEAITTKQLLAKDTTMPIKVRIEYRKDLNNTDLPTGQVVLDLVLTLEYIQSDGTGSNVKDNGVYVSPVKVVKGDLDTVGSEVCINDECFYVISSNSDSVTMLAKYNLYVGYYCSDRRQSSCVAYGNEATGIQDSTMIGITSTGYIGGTKFSNGDSNYNGSIVEEYVNNYHNYLVSLNVVPLESRLISYDELISLGCTWDYDYEKRTCKSAPEWVYSTSYWSGTAWDDYSVWGVCNDDTFDFSMAIYEDSGYYYGVRPVIVISKSYF